MPAADLVAQNQNDPQSTPEEVASARNTLDLLRVGRFADLEKKMTALQHGYESGAIGDERLLHESRPFYATDPSLEAQYNSWIKAFPSSYSAYLARGIYYRYRGAEARGTRFASETPREQMNAMEAFNEKAMRDYERAVPLTAKPLIAYHAILGVAMLEGDRELADEMLKKSLGIDPKNFVVRYKYFNTLQTRWGGSLQQMIDFAREARAAGLPATQMRYFDNLIEVERRWLQQRR